MTHLRQFASILMTLNTVGCVGGAQHGHSTAVQKPSSTVSTSTVPLLGFPVALYHYDFHWYFWLSRHPQFEAAEVMTAERPGRAPLIWVFFTERAGAKRQHHYVNDAPLAAALGWTFRDISFKMGGGAGEAKGLDVSLEDDAGRPVAITMDFDPGTQLSRTGRRGLTSQSGHSGDKHFMIFYRNVRASAPRGTMKIGGINYALLPDEPLGSFPARYTNSGDIYVGIIGYGRQTVPFGAVSTTVVSDGSRVLSRRLPSGAVSSVTIDANRTLVEERQSLGPKAVITRFSPGVPPCSAASPPAASRFSISVDIDPNIITGVATRRCDKGDSIIEFRPTTPEWAAAQPFVVRQGQSAGTEVSLTTSRLKR